jgi:hypothetical protein
LFFQKTGDLSHLSRGKTGRRVKIATLTTHIFSQAQAMCNLVRQNT